MQQYIPLFSVGREMMAMMKICTDLKSANHQQYQREKGNKYINKSSSEEYL
jgi:hypothetical protein